MCFLMPSKSDMTQSTAPSTFPIPASEWREENWLTCFNDPSKELVTWMEGEQRKQKLAGEQLRERLCGVPFYAKRAAKCLEMTGSEAKYWESLLSGTHNF